MSFEKFNLRCKKREEQPVEEIKIFLVQEDWGVTIQAGSDMPVDSIFQLWNDGTVFVNSKGAELFNLRIGYLETK